MNNRDLKIALKDWRESLSLQSWDIIVTQVEPYQLDIDATASSNIDQFHQKARIKIVADEYQDKDSPSYETTEFLLVHELLHIRLFPDGIADGSPQALALEQGINQLVRHLLFTKYI